MRNLEKKDWRLSQQSCLIQFQRVGRLSKNGKQWKAPDIKKKTLSFLRTVNYVRLRGFDIEYLLTHEIVVTSYYLTKDG